MIPSTQGTQAWDRYAYVNNNPVRYNDPTGHYGEEVHHDLTSDVVYDIALASAQDYGYSEHRAMAFANNLVAEVVRGDMAADVMNPDGSTNLNYAYNQPVTCPGYVTHEIGPGYYTTTEYRTPHWYTTSEAESDLQNSSDDPFDDPFGFGVAMHEYQDSFSHWQKLGEPATPQGIWAGHAGNQYTSLTGGESIDHYDPTQGQYKDIDQAMLTGMTTGFGYWQTANLALNLLTGY
jgi:hypothetical protein